MIPIVLRGMPSALDDPHYQHYINFLAARYHSMKEGQRQSSLVGVALREIHRLEGNEALSGHYKDFFFAAEDFLAKNPELGRRLRNIELATIHVEDSDLKAVLDEIQPRFSAWLPTYEATHASTSREYAQNKLAPNWGGKVSGGGGGSGNLARSLVLAAHFVDAHGEQATDSQVSSALAEINVSAPTDDRALRARRLELETRRNGLVARMNAVGKRVNTRFGFDGDQERLEAWRAELDQIDAQLKLV